MTQDTSTSYTFLRDSEEESSGDIAIDYASLEDLSQKDFTVDPEDALYSEEKDTVAFYCRDCKSNVDVKRVTKKIKQRKKLIPKMHFECQVCQGKRVLYGTVRGLSKMFHS